MPTEEPQSAGRLPLPPLQTAIEFSNVSYTYPGASQPALDRLSLSIPKGKKMALVGPNGSGKTTMTALLERFVEPSDGQILLDGHDIRKFSIRSLREQVSLVTQDAVVFPTTAAENVAYGRADATREQVERAARQAYAHEFIERLPQGYDTVLGEFGATLSGGEKQRLALARAILRDAPIFIFDEATSQIDVDSEKKIQQAVAEFMVWRTSIVIAHRIATIADADQIAVFDQGKLVGLGDHSALLARCPLYKTLYTTHAQAAS